MELTIFIWERSPGFISSISLLMDLSLVSASALRSVSSSMSNWISAIALSSASSFKASVLIVLSFFDATFSSGDFLAGCYKRCVTASLPFSLEAILLPDLSFASISTVSRGKEIQVRGRSCCSSFFIIN